MNCSEVDYHSVIIFGFDQYKMELARIWKDSKEEG